MIGGILGILMPFRGKLKRIAFARHEYRYYKAWHSHRIDVYNTVDCMFNVCSSIIDKICLSLCSLYCLLSIVVSVEKCVVENC